MMKLVHGCRRHNDVFSKNKIDDEVKNEDSKSYVINFTIPNPVFILFYLIGDLRT